MNPFDASRKVVRSCDDNDGAVNVFVPPIDSAVAVFVVVSVVGEIASCWCCCRRRGPTTPSVAAAPDDDDDDDDDANAAPTLALPPCPPGDKVISLLLCHDD
jgi:hypothetical protein